MQKFPNRKISILVNNAGHSKLLPLIDHEKVNSPFCLKPGNLQEASDVYSSMLDTNVLGPTLVTREAMKHFDHSKVHLFWGSSVFFDRSIRTLVKKFFDEEDRLII